MKGKIFIMIISGLLLMHCQKVKLPPPMDGMPVFEVAASLGVDDLNIIAGEEGYVMRASNEQDTSGLTLYTATFEQLDGTGEQLRFIFRGVDAQQALPDSALQAKAYDYLVPMSDTSYLVHRATFSSAVVSNDVITPYAYYWDFGDGTTSNEANPVHDYDDLEDRRVYLEVTGANGVKASYERYIIWGFTAPECVIDFSVQGIMNNNGVQISLLSSPSLPYTNYMWNGSSIDSLDFVNFTLAGGNSTQQCLYATLGTAFEDVCTATVCKGIYSVASNPINFIGYLETSYTFSIEEVEETLPAPEQLGTVIIEYTAEDGTVYSSSINSQPGDAFFLVNAIEEYDDNELGEATRKMDIQFNANLYNETGQLFAPVSGEASIAVSLPD